MATPPKMIEAGVGIGEIFLGKYRVDSIVGHGGMGLVAACTHIQLNERVAIKMLRKDVLDDMDAVERFMREAQAASKLRSEYVARVTDVGRSHTNVPYMVMEYLEGSDLGHLLDARGSLAVSLAIELTLQACEALAEAHSIGIVHRDVKPSNLFMTWRPDGSVLIKVLDFGISKAPTGAGMLLTQTQSLLGTPAYMSPEQMRSARMVDARTDIWSLGTVLYEALEGYRPFVAESFSEMCVKVAVDPPGAMKATPPALQQVVLKCLEKSPEQRYQTMADLARDLVPFANDPYAAQAMVERMARMLRRVHSVDWDPMTSGVRKLTSAEVAAGLSNPAIPIPVHGPRSGPHVAGGAAASGPAAAAAPGAAASLGAQNSGANLGGAAKSGAANPGAANPGAGNLGAGNLGAGHLGAGHVGAVNPGAGNLGAGNPGAGHLGAAANLDAAVRPGAAAHDTPSERLLRTMAVVRPRRKRGAALIVTAIAAAAALGVVISLSRGTPVRHTPPQAAPAAKVAPAEPPPAPAEPPAVVAPAPPTTEAPAAADIAPAAVERKPDPRAAKRAISHPKIEKPNLAVPLPPCPKDIAFAGPHADQPPCRELPK